MCTCRQEIAAGQGRDNPAYSLRTFLALSFLVHDHPPALGGEDMPAPLQMPNITLRVSSSNLYNECMNAVMPETVTMLCVDAIVAMCGELTSRAAFIRGVSAIQQATAIERKKAARTPFITGGR